MAVNIFNLMRSEAVQRWMKDDKQKMIWDFAFTVNTYPELQWNDLDKRIFMC